MVKGAVSSHFGLHRGEIMTTKTRDLLDIVWMYLLLALLGIWVADAVEGTLIWRAGAADLAMTFMVFGFSLWKSNSSTYDAYWSVIPSYLTIWLFFVCDGASWSWLQWGPMLVVNLWSWRLTHNWARGWPGWQHEDWRYVDFREQQGKAFQFTNFFGIHLFPTAIVFLSCVGLFEVAVSTTFEPWLLLLGLGVGLVGVAFELIADNQLAAFRGRTNPQPEDILDTGLWGVIRYPNYLGEMLFWWGVALCGLGAGGGWWMVLGAVSMMLLFVLASIPMKDKRMESRKPAFGEYKSRVPAIIPGLW